MYLTDAQIQTSLLPLLKLNDATTLAAYWTTIISDCHQQAYNEVQGRLLERGYTAAQIAAWDRGAELEKDLSLYWCLTKGAGLNGTDDKWIKVLDRRKELETISVSNAGKVVNPGPVGLVGFGTLSTGVGAFVYQPQPSSDPDNPTSILDGQRTKW